MFTSNKFAYQLVSVMILLSLIFSGFQPLGVSAQGQDGLKRQVNAETGRVSFIGPENDRVVSASRALGTFIRPQDPAMALANRFAPEFGIKDPAHELSEIRTSHPADGRVIVRYQQSYQGIPVIGGELIVNTNENGDLYSMNGEVSPDLSLQIQPEVASEQARDSALQEAAKWYQKTPADFVASEPELWIFDESLLKPSTRPVELVWRMDVTAVNNTAPVRELVLVNAQKGDISLHFNQIDTAWAAPASGEVKVAQDTSPTETPTATETPIPTETPLPIDTPVAESTPIPTDIISNNTSSSDAVVIPLAVTTWYVATTGNDANSCTATGSPCLTINGAIGKAVDGDTIKVATGTYTGSGTEVVLINKSVTLSGGWNASFTTQSGMSTIDGQNIRREMSVNGGMTVTIEALLIQNGSYTSTPFYGGGILNSGNLIINKSAIGNNKATDGGGNYNTGTLTINQSSIVHNNAAYGGGINNEGGQVKLNNSTVSGNTVGLVGGGFYNQSSGSMNLNSSTVSGNKADGGIYGSGGGFYNWSGSITLQNSIIASNSTSSSSPDCNGFVSLGYNLIGDTTGCFFTASTGDQSNMSAQLGPLVGNPAYHPLSSTSPAVNSGNPGGCVGSTGSLTTDQRGASRVGNCDIGAYEYTTPGVIASVATVGGTPQSTNPLTSFAVSLQAMALDSIGNPKPGVTVTFTAPASGASGIFADSGTRTTTATTNTFGVAPAASFTANSTGGNYVVTASAAGAGSSASFQLTNGAWFVTPSGNDANDCLSPSMSCATINGAINKAGIGQIIKVAIGTYTDTGTEVVYINKDITLSGGWNATFTTQNGKSTIDGESARRGVYLFGLPGATALIESFIVQKGQGGVVNNGATLTLNNSTVINNSGGGVWSGGILTINNSVISSNTDGDGGGGIEINGGTVTISTTVVKDNISSSYGGGIYNGGALTLNNSTVSGNIANNGGGTNGGGGVFNGGSLTTNNSTISGNTALGGSNGGGILGSGTLKNTILAGNIANSAPDCSGIVGSSGYNLIGNTWGCTFTSSTGDLVGTAASPINPRLTPLQDNGGSTFTHALIAGSPAINAGNPATCLSTDQRGIARPQGATCDIGAFEYQPGTTPSSISMLQGSPQIIGLGTVATQNLVVVVADSSGAGVQGVTVTFTAPLSGASGTFSNTGTNITTAITGFNGVATASTFTANTVVGSYSVQATVNGVAGSANFNLISHLTQRAQWA